MFEPSFLKVPFAAVFGSVFLEARELYGGVLSFKTDTQYFIISKNTMSHYGFLKAPFFTIILV